MNSAHELAAQLEAAYASLCRTFGLLQPDEIETGKIENGWSPKALMAHVAFWDAYQTQRMQAALAGTSATDGFTRPEHDNDERAEIDHARPWEAVLAAADSARAEMISFAQSLDEGQLTTAHPEGEGTLSLEKLLEHMVRHTRLHAQELQRHCGSLDRWSRGALREFLVQQHATLMDSIGGLSEETIISTPVCGAWSIRDVLVHVLSWNEYEHAVLRQWPDAAHESLTPWLDGNGIDDINAHLLAERAELNMIDVCDGLMTYHRRILRTFDKMNEEQLRASGDYGWGEVGTLSNFFYEFALHEAAHAEDIWRYRAATATANRP